MSDTTSPITDSAIWAKADRVARSVVTGIHGPRPSVPSSDTPRFLHAASQAQFDAVFDAVDRQRAWDRRVRALTHALATEARRIEDRGIMRRMPMVCASKVRSSARREGAAA